MTLRPGDPLVGSLLDDRYQIVRRIARGGMATVFEAVDQRLARTVAVKVLHPGLDEDGDISARFDTEARAAARLSHPNVVAVFDQGRDQGRPYIVMEYVRGVTLRHLITLESPFAPARALQLFEPVVAAVAAAHAAGIIHRDVKPENVLISEQGQVKVADFGLARPVTAATVAEGGVVLGTVSYIAPELVSRGHASTRSDVYSLGILLYELLTGLKPYRGLTPLEVAYAHVHSDVPAPSASGHTAVEVPAFLDALVHTTTTRSPARRQADAAVLLTQVRGAREALTDGVSASAALGGLMAALTRDDAEHARESALPRAATPRTATSVVSSASVASAPLALASAALATLVPPWALRTPGAPDADGAGPAAHDPEPAEVEPISPYSPPSRRIVPPRRDWVDSPEHRRRRRRTAAVAAAVAFVLLVGGWWALAGRLPAVPRVAGLEQRDAQAAVTTAGLVPQFVREYSDTVPAGVATRADPAEGARLEQGSAVIVYLSQGAQVVDVPVLKGKTRDEALRALSDAGLVAGAITEAFDPKVPVGSVISQAAAAGTSLRHGSGVDFVISQGAQPVDLADWVGKPGVEARIAIVASGLRVKIGEVSSSSVPKGRVVSQTPAAGALHKGDWVTLIVSRGPSTATTAATPRG